MVKNIFQGGVIRSNINGKYLGVNEFSGLKILMGLGVFFRRLISM